MRTNVESLIKAKHVVPSVALTLLWVKIDTHQKKRIAISMVFPFCLSFSFLPTGLVNQGRRVHICLCHRTNIAPIIKGGYTTSSSQSSCCFCSAIWHHLTLFTSHISTIASQRLTNPAYKWDECILILKLLFAKWPYQQIVGQTLCQIVTMRPEHVYNIWHTCHNVMFYKSYAS